jgi:lipopolysaccharide/colanic/teichoic acid biosynthesis glycosyltransferase
MLQTRTQTSPWRRAFGLGTAMPQWIVAGSRRDKRLYERTKRVFDVVLSIVLLVLLAPLMLLIAIAIKLDSPGPVIYVQKRVGKDGLVFPFYKFRSMTNGDHTHTHREFARAYINGHSAITDGLQKPPGALRAVTRVGRILRKTSLDELPQLVCILKGDMSFVGPRPLMAYEAEAFEPWQWRRVDVTPGLTGLAQINGRSRLSFDEIVRLDLQYIEARSWGLDLSILLRTIPQVLAGKDAG